MAYTKGSRYTKIPGSDNKFLFASKEIQSPVYASTIDLAITAEETIVDHAQLTGDLTETVDIANSYTGDRLRCLYTTDGSVRTVTFSTNFIADPAVIKDSSQLIIDFVFMGAVGTSGTWVETSRKVFA